MTPWRPVVNGSIPAMLTVPVGAMRFPDRRRSSVVLPAPLARRGQRQGERCMGGEKKDDIPPMSSVRLPGGRLRTTSWRPEEPS